MNIGSAICLARKNLGITRKALAEKVGLSPSAITRIENGERGLPLQTAQEIAQALGLRLSQLVIIAESILKPEDEIRALQSKLLLSIQPIFNQETSAIPASNQHPAKPHRSRHPAKTLSRTTTR